MGYQPINIIESWYKKSKILPDIGVANKGIKESSAESKESTLDYEVVAFMEQDGKKTIRKKNMW